MKRIRTKFLISTPMFLAGANISNEAELRPASIKGILRFWFRAIGYGKYSDLKKVKEAEDKLFGSTTEQSKIFLSLHFKDIKVETNQSQCKKLFSQGISYLGYGLEDGGQSKGRNKAYRSFIAPNQAFNLDLIVHPDYSNQMYMEDLIKAIKALGLFGGLGSRSRRGFGSITLNSIHVNHEEYWVAPTSREELAKAFKDFYYDLDLQASVPEYTAFSKNNRTVILQEFNSYKEALEEVGKAMMEFRRGYGSDATIISDYLRRGRVTKHPKRVVFGLPHNYFFRNLGTVTINPAIGEARTRRASPLFIKVLATKKDNTTKYIPVLTLFPSKFLPEHSTLVLSGRRGRQDLPTKSVEPIISLAPINEFMDSLSNRAEVMANG